MSSEEALKAFFGILGAVLAVPLLIVLVKAGMFFGSLARSVSALESAATSFTVKVDKVLDKLVEQGNDHETRIQLVEQFVDAEKIDLGWAPDRRRKKPEEPKE